MAKDKNMKKMLKILAMPHLSAMNEIEKQFKNPTTIETSGLAELIFTITNNKLEIFHKGVDIITYDFVWIRSNWNVRDLGYAVTKYLQAHHVPTTPSEKTTSKVTDHVLFSLNNINAPNTVHLHVDELKKHLDIIDKVCGYPLIIKDIRGLGGMLSYLVHNSEELIKTVQSLPKHRRYIFQEYIPNDFDWGVMVSKGEVVSGEKSYPAPGEFRNNACHGSREEFVSVSDIPSNVKQMAIDASEALGLEWSRADIIINKKTQAPYILEVNRAPGVTSKSDEVTAAYNHLSSVIYSQKKD